MAKNSSNGAGVAGETPPELPVGGAIGNNHGVDFWAEVETLHAALGEMSYFEILGVAPDCSAVELTAAYHQALRRFHPDRHIAKTIGYDGTHALRMLAQICARVGEAYRVLSKAATRAEYMSSLAVGTKRQRKQRVTFTETRDPKSEKARNLLASARDLRGRGSRSAAKAKLDLALQFEPESSVLNRERDALEAEEAERRRPSGEPPANTDDEGPST